ncbi:hypothetical protein PoB_002226300 [Plakobranchus ocellatus]|uniref:Uncharacterized protein n=1 Tax=Plakobranchus ocellatus TaxID=259542 RepID=A0AAV3ZME6_9GAST|nr:hypothetical protein PoB_002226300 [Plakobranchus ocellatus]
MNTPRFLRRIQAFLNCPTEKRRSGPEQRGQKSIATTKPRIWVESGSDPAGIQSRAVTVAVAAEGEGNGNRGSHNNGVIKYLGRTYWCLGGVRIAGVGKDGVEVQKLGWRG